MAVAWLATSFFQTFGPQFVLITIIAILTLLLLKRYDRKRHNYPPGPTAWPFLGNLPLFASRPSEPYIVTSELAERYGPIYSLYFGDYLVVFFNDYQVIREAFVKQEDVFSDRPRNLKVWKETIEGIGLGVVNGKDWNDIHRSAIRSLREAGVGSEKVEQRILTEANVLTEVMGATKGRPFDPCLVTKRAFSNLTFNICLGERFDDYADSQFNKMVTTLYTFLDDMRVAMTESFLPILSYIRPVSMISKMKKSLDTMDSFMDDYLQAHKMTHDSDSCRDVLDYFLEKQKQAPERELYSDLSINRTIGGLLNGGIESTQMVLRWLFLYFLHYPEIQEKCFQQIHEVLGNEKEPSWEVKDRLSYVMATILEVLRHANIAPIGVPHAASRDTYINGYFIPEGTMVFMNLYQVHMDPKYWPEPKAFKPERWLDENGKLIRHEAFIPFSIGKRHCLGEQLAKQELLLILTRLLQRFEFLPPDGATIPDLRGVQKLSLGPKDFTICAKSRDQS